VASAEPRTWELAALRARLTQEPFATAIRRVWGVDTAEGMLAHFAAGPGLARRLAALPGQSRNTDDNMLLEFAFARTVGRTGGFDMRELYSAAWDLGAGRPALQGVADWARVVEEREVMYSDGFFPPPSPQTSGETQARYEIRRLVQQNSFAAASHVWLATKPAPLNPGDTLTFASILAETGSSEALPFIERLRAFSPGEAATLTAALERRTGHPEQERSALLAAFAAFRSDPWPTDAVLVRAFGLASELADTDAASVGPLFDAIHAAPLPGYLMEAGRRTILSHLTMRQWRTGQRIPVSGYALFEPWPEWTGDFLKNRYTLYRATGLGNAELARNELAEFLSAEPAPFAWELRPDAKASSPAPLIGARH